MTTNYGWTTPDDSGLVSAGASNIRTLGSAIDTTLGTGLLAWSSYTPTLTNFTLGNGTMSARYSVVGKRVWVKFTFTAGSTSTFSAAAFFISTPSTMQSTGAIGFLGMGHYKDASPVATYLGQVTWASTTAIQMKTVNAAGTYATLVDATSTVPITFTTSDQIELLFSYEAA